MFAGDDSLTGGYGDDTLYGGLGADELRGSAGDDWLHFDAADTVVLGGGGRDVAVAQGTDPVTLDLTTSSIEIVIGTSPDNLAGDTFLNVGRNEMVAAGAGDDYASVVTGGTGRPTVLWGGEGADTGHGSAVTPRRRCGSGLTGAGCEYSIGG